MAANQTTQVRNHWYWRPGWQVGSRFYTWHITFEDQPDVVALANAYRDVLDQQPSLDVVPNAWLHLTMQGIGFVDQTDHRDVDKIVARAHQRCADLQPITLAVGEPYIDPESIQIAVQPAESVRNLRKAIRASIGDVWGSDRVPEPAEPYTPHMSLAYINAEGPAQPLADALAKAPKAAASANIKSCQLIVLNRDRRIYEWETYATVPIGG
jgi:2'-5' RNA ligase